MLNAQDQAAIDHSNALQREFEAKSNAYGADYSSYQNQANQAQGDIQNFNKYMAGEGSASNLYNKALTSQQGQTGYDANQMKQSMSNLSQAQGSLSAYNDFANTAASKWGMNAGGLVAANQGAQGSINNNIAAASQGFQNQQKAYELAQTGANQEAGLGVQQQQTQLAGYKNVYDNAFAQQSKAQENMQAYAKLAQDQGGLTAQQQQAYAQSSALMIQANAAMKQAQAAILSAQGSYANNMAQAGATNYNTSQTKAANDKAAADAAQQIASQGFVGPTKAQTEQNHSMAQNRASFAPDGVGSVLGAIGNWWNTSPLF